MNYIRNKQQEQQKKHLSLDSASDDINNDRSLDSANYNRSANGILDMVMDDKREHSTEAQEWCFRLMNDPEYFKRWRYTDNINAYNSIIEEFQKLYEKTPVTDRFVRARILTGMKKSKRDLAKTMADYEIFNIDENCNKQLTGIFKV